MFGIKFDPSIGVGTIIVIVTLFLGWLHNWITAKVDRVKRDQIGEQTSESLVKVSDSLDKLTDITSRHDERLKSLENGRR